MRPEALKELDCIELPRAPVSNEGWDRAMGDPSVRWLRGRALEETGRREDGEPLMADPSQVLSSYGPWWATRGRWARGRGDEAAAVVVASGGRRRRSRSSPKGCESRSTLDPGKRSLAASGLPPATARLPLCAGPRGLPGRSPLTQTDATRARSLAA